MIQFTQEFIFKIKIKCYSEIVNIFIENYDGIQEKSE